MKSKEMIQRVVNKAIANGAEIVTEQRESALTAKDMALKTRPELVKLGNDWLAYTLVNTYVPKKGLLRDRFAHAFAYGYYASGAIHSGAMFLVNVRGASELETWAKMIPLTKEELAAI